MRAILLSFVLLTACRDHPPAPSPLAVSSATPSDPVMIEHGVRGVAMREALVAGNVEHARFEARALAAATSNHEPSLPRNLDSVRPVAEEVARAKSVDEACAAAAKLARVCGSCHVGLVGPKPSLERAPPDGVQVVPRMRRHAWAAERLWDGLVRPSNAAWKEGASVLVDAPLAPERLTPGRTSTPEIDTLARAVRRVAYRAAETNGDEERAALYGELLATCASWHDRLRCRPRTLCPALRGPASAGDTGGSARRDGASHARDELVGVRRLHQVGIEEGRVGRQVRRRAQREDGQGRAALTQAAHEDEPVLPGHPDVADHDVEVRGVQHRERGVGALGRSRRGAVRREDGSEDLAHVALVVDDQHAQTVERSPALSRPFHFPLRHFCSGRVDHGGEIDGADVDGRGAGLHGVDRQKLVDPRELPVHLPFDPRERLGARVGGERLTMKELRPSPYLAHGAADVVHERQEDPRERLEVALHALPVDPLAAHAFLDLRQATPEPVPDPIQLASRLDDARLEAPRRRPVSVVSTFAFIEAQGHGVRVVQRPVHGRETAAAPRPVPRAHRGVGGPRSGARLCVSGAKSAQRAQLSRPRRARRERARRFAPTGATFAALADR